MIWIPSIERWDLGYRKQSRAAIRPIFSQPHRKPLLVQCRSIGLTYWSIRNASRCPIFLTGTTPPLPSYRRRPAPISAKGPAFARKTGNYDRILLACIV